MNTGNTNKFQPVVSASILTFLL